MVEKKKQEYLFAPMSANKVLFSYIAIGVVCLIVGFVVGGPTVINLDEMTKDSLINKCDNSLESLERDLKKDCSKLTDGLLDRNKDLAGRNSELIESLSKVKQPYDAVLADMNKIMFDLNKHVWDLNCKKK